MSGIWKKAALGLLLQGVALCGLCATGQAMTSAPPPVKIALLLPLRSPTLGVAAEAVRAGVQAAYEQDRDGAVLTLYETDGSTTDLLTTYEAAAARHDLVIGPLARSEVATLAERADISKPTLALAQAEPVDKTDKGARLSPRLLRMGLSLEDEARQVADWIAAGKGSSSAWVISTAVPWQKRAAQAFVAEWRARKLPVQHIEVPAVDGLLDANRLAALRKRLRAEVPAVLFVALDAGQAAQVRAALGTDTAMYGTSQLNGRARVLRESPLPADSAVTETRVALEGVLLVDIPWQVEPDHPAVRLYPQLLGQVEPPPSADQARLYALGIDAWRVARELLLRRSRFELEGVTGRLRVRMDPGAAVLSRDYQPAAYRRGDVHPIDLR